MTPQRPTTHCYYVDGEGNEINQYTLLLDIASRYFIVKGIDDELFK
jgi:hypothetical protein